MDNIAFLDSPYSEGVIVPTRGVAYDAKAAKLNNTTKKPYVLKHWKEKRPNSFRLADSNTRLEIKSEPVSASKDYTPLLGSLNMTAVEHDKEVNNSGGRKLRVNKIVIGNSSKVYRVSKKASVQIKQPQVTQEEEVVNLVNQINALSEPVEEVKREDVHGRHEHTGEIPVNDVRTAIRNELTQNIPTISRMERNALEHENLVKQEESRQETKAGDIDLYNNLLHNGKGDDVSRQLQGAREELSIEKEESKKLAEQYSKAVRELEELKLDIENKRKMKAQQERRELSETLNNLETLKKENLERTSDLSSIQNEIAKLKAERQEMESNFYDNSRSFGRRAA